MDRPQQHPLIHLTRPPGVCGFSLDSGPWTLSDQLYLVWSWMDCRGPPQSCSSIRPSESPSTELSQLEFGDSAPCSPSSCSRLPARPRGPTLECWSITSRSRKLMYLRARRRISFLLSFLSGGCVGMRRRSSANAPLTFCCRHRSRLLVETRRMS